MVRILALRERFEHMSAVSGYDALYNHLPPNMTLDSIFCNFKKIYPRGIGRLLSATSKLASSSGFYSAQSVEAELRLLTQLLIKGYDIIHYSYGESYYGLLGVQRKKRPAVVLTHHQPVTWWHSNERLLNRYDRVDAVIALSEYDRDYLNQHIDGKAVCIPHGVDITFFRPLEPPPKKRGGFRVIFSGRYLRDIETLAGVIKKISKVIDIVFDIVYIKKEKVRQQCLIDIMQLPNVNWYADISEHELLSLYQNADCSIVPLEDCTANNALLEAMACGLPIVATALPAISTYVDENMAILARKGNVDDLCDALVLLYNDERLRNRMSINARNKAVQHFDWDRIAKETFNLFDSLR